MKVCIFLYQTFFFPKNVNVGYTVSTKQTDCFGGGVSQHGVAGGDNFNDSGLLMLARLKKQD